MLPVSRSSSNRVHLDSNSSSASGNKRSASMIFRIEHLLPTSLAPDVSQLQAANHHIRPMMRTSLSPSAASQSSRGEDLPQSPTTTPSKRAKLQQQQRAGVFVSQFTRKDTLSESIATLALMSVNATTSSEESQSPRAYCILSAGNLLHMTPTILRKIKLSEDIHSYNALFELCSAGGVRLRIVRDICAEDEIVAWFGEEATLLMAIPFLTPLNIQGNNRYTCHLCQLTFETPNPLKIHLALGCGRHSMDILWMRLHYAVSATKHYSRQHLLPPSVPPLAAQLSPPLQNYYANTSITTAASSTSSISPASSPQPAAQTQASQPPALPQRFSAFKPISPSSHSSVTCSSASSAPPQPTSIGLPQHSTSATRPTTTNSLTSFLPNLTASMGLSSMGLSSMSLFNPPGGLYPFSTAAQIEAIVSNMGASKDGHICMYCGKIYSRKYGLKIHIRTHTGFKPLTCKFCDRPFGDPSNLNKHVRLHLQTSGPGTATSGGPTEGYQCHLCHKKLARRRDLQRHMESRHANDEEVIEVVVGETASEKTLP